MSALTPFTREELIDLREKAIYFADGTGGQNASWTRAYQQLADAANYLDAMLARSVVREND